MRTYGITGCYVYYYSQISNYLLKNVYYFQKITMCGHLDKYFSYHLRQVQKKLIFWNKSVRYLCHEIYT